MVTVPGGHANDTGLLRQELDTGDGSVGVSKASGRRMDYAGNRNRIRRYMSGHIREAQIHLLALMVFKKASIGTGMIAIAG
jgi:hypothetical protein